MPVAYIYILGSYFLIKQKMNKSEKNYIKFARPVAKHMAEYASKGYLEGVLSAWDFITGFYRYKYVFWRLKQFFFSEFCQFHPYVSFLSRKLHMQCLSLALLSHSHRKQGNFM
jgi:hypothetical protein